MRRRRWRLALPIAASVALALASCTGSDEERRNVLVLIDYSGSTSGDQVLRYASTIARDVVGLLHEHDAIAVYPIDGGAVTRNGQIVGFDLQRQDFADRKDFVTHASEEVQKRITAFLVTAADSVERAVRSERDHRRRFAGRTDILGALNGLSQHLEHDQPISRAAAIWNGAVGQRHVRTQNIIVICSDMINESDAGDFEAHTPTVSEADTVVARLRRTGAIPELKDALVFVTGRTGRNAQQVDGIKAFWVALFREAHADLRAYDFDAGGQLRQFFGAR